MVRENEGIAHLEQTWRYKAKSKQSLLYEVNSRVWIRGVTFKTQRNMSGKSNASKENV